MTLEQRKVALEQLVRLMSRNSRELDGERVILDIDFEDLAKDILEELNTTIFDKFCMLQI